MITKFKLYEGRFSEYEVGDYVLLDLNELTYRGEYDELIQPIDDKAKIVDDLNFDRSWDIFNCELYNNSIYEVYSDEIVRRLTSKEIEEFEIKKNQYRYNL